MPSVSTAAASAVSGTGADVLSDSLDAALASYDDGDAAAVGATSPPTFDVVLRPPSHASSLNCLPQALRGRHHRVRHIDQALSSSNLCLVTSASLSVHSCVLVLGP